MMVELRKTLVWATAVAAVASAMLLASNGGSLPRLGDASRARLEPGADAPTDSARRPAGSRAGPAGSAR